MCNDGGHPAYTTKENHMLVWCRAKKKKPLSRWFEMEKKIAVSHSVHTTLTSPREVSRPTTFVSIRGRRRKGAPPPHHPPLPNDHRTHEKSTTSFANGSSTWGGWLLVCCSTGTLWRAGTPVFPRFRISSNRVRVCCEFQGSGRGTDGGDFPSLDSSGTLMQLLW